MNKKNFLIAILGSLSIIALAKFLARKIRSNTIKLKVQSSDGDTNNSLYIETNEEDLKSALKTVEDFINSSNDEN